MKAFLRNLLATICGLILVGILLILVIAGLASQDGVPKVPDKAVLMLNLATPIADKPMTEELEAMLQNLAGGGQKDTITLRAVLDSIEHAIQDDRIKAIYLTGSVGRQGYASGWAAMREVREKLLAFRDSGKPIISYQMGLNEIDLYVASTASRLVLNPFGVVEFNGFAAQVMYYKAFFEKYGIDVQVTRVGKYKSAVEPYMLDAMSDPNREQLETLLSDLFDACVEGVAQSRGQEAGALRQLAQETGFIGAQDALTHGLVDEADYFDTVLDQLKQLTGVEPGEKMESLVSVKDYYKGVQAKKSEHKDKVVVIYAEGAIVNGKNEKNVGGATLAKLLRRARLDDEVKAVVLRVNSPGGSAQASEVIQRETRLIAEQKPLVVSMGTVAASGGYWISAYANRVFASPNTITGSIGVFGMLPNIKEIMNEHGINVDVAKTSETADIQSLFRPKTEEELALIQKFIDFIYDEFLDKVAEGRGLDRDAVHEIAQGRVWSGTQAHQLGLVDELGGLYDAVDWVATEAGLGEYALVEYQKPKELLDEILEDLGLSARVQRHPMAGVYEQLGTLTRVLEACDDPNGAYARLPYDLIIE